VLCDDTSTCPATVVEAPAEIESDLACALRQIAASVETLGASVRRFQSLQYPQLAVSRISGSHALAAGRMVRINASEGFANAVASTLHARRGTVGKDIRIPSCANMRLTRRRKKVLTTGAKTPLPDNRFLCKAAAIARQKG